MSIKIFAIRNRNKDLRQTYSGIQLNCMHCLFLSPVINISTTVRNWVGLTEYVWNFFLLTLQSLLLYTHLYHLFYRTHASGCYLLTFVF